MTRSRGRIRRKRNRAAARRTHRRARPREVLARRERLAALGEGDEAAERSMDELRNAIARRIHMVLNRWRDCRIGLCKRNRGCMAPGGVCGASRGKPAPTGEAFGRMMAAINRELEARLAEPDAAEGK